VRRAAPAPWTSLPSAMRLTSPKAASPSGGHLGTACSRPRRLCGACWHSATLAGRLSSCGCWRGTAPAGVSLPRLLRVLAPLLSSVLGFSHPSSLLVPAPSSLALRATAPSVGRCGRPSTRFHAVAWHRLLWRGLRPRPADRVAEGWHVIVSSPAYHRGWPRWSSVAPRWLLRCRLVVSVPHGAPERAVLVRVGREQGQRFRRPLAPGARVACSSLANWLNAVVSEAALPQLPDLSRASLRDLLRQFTAG
jgi:hypothetical protein